MIVYWSLLLWTAFVALTWKKWFIVKVGISGGESYVRPTVFSLFCSFIPLIFIAGMRSDWGDTIAYIKQFNSITPTLAGIKLLGDRDKLFYICSLFIKMIYPHPNFWLTVIAAVQVALICVAVARYSDMPGVSIFLFIASSEWASYMMNGMRQFVAVTICFAAFRLLVEKKYFWYAAVVVLAAQFHGTAYIMLFAMIVVFIEPWSRQMYLAIMAFAVALVFLNPILSNVQGLFEETQYEGEIVDLIESAGVNVIRAFVAAVPCVIAFIFRRNRALYAERKNRIAINFSMLNAAIFIAASIVGGNLMARIAEYFTIFQLLTYPALFKNCFKGRARTIVVSAFAVLYLVWFWYDFQYNRGAATYVSNVLGWYL